jgi:hypothetical protein
MSELNDDAIPGDGELTDSDRALLESAAQEKRDPTDAAPDSLEANDAIRLDVGTQPASVTSRQALEYDGYEDNIDGLAPLEEVVRQQAEDRATGEEEDYIG